MGSLLRSPSLRARLAKASIETATRFFSPEQHAATLVKLFRKVVA
jgi:hypothetical protein